MASNPMKTKIETCLILCGNAQDFKGKVKKVLDLSSRGFDDIELCADIYADLVEGRPVPEILRYYFS